MESPGCFICRQPLVLIDFPHHRNLQLRLVYLTVISVPLQIIVLLMEIFVNSFANILYF